MKRLFDLLKDFYNWMGTDGLLHFLVCYSLVLTFQPIVGLIWAVVIAVIPALAKEGWDYFIQKDNSSLQVKHDLMCDWFGIAAALTVITLWNII